MSAHHYFRRFAYCDSGQIPWLLVTQLMCESGKRLSELVGERIARFPASGEINRKVADSQATIKRVQEHYQPTARAVDFTDGVSMEFDRWRFNLRSSNTEPLIRLNVGKPRRRGVDAHAHCRAAADDRRRRGALVGSLSGQFCR
jgi:phosphomannomutase/phosphomannomutase/phosphoglucomutase